MAKANGNKEIACTLAHNNVSILIYGVRGSQPRKFSLVNYPFDHAHIWHQFVVLQVVYKSVPSKNDKVMSIRRFSIAPWGIPLQLTPPQTCAGHFHARAQNWCQKLAYDQCFIMRHCVIYCIPRVSSYSP